jgi:hypothetical protein
MKNYLVKGMHRIESTEWWEGKDRANEGDLYSLYTHMNELSKISFHRYLEGDWSLINLVSTAKSPSHVFRQQFYALQNLWENEPCNILYCGADTQMIKPTKMFGAYEHFMMFNYTDPKCWGPVAHFLNADIRYFPSTMHPNLWIHGNREIPSLDWWNGDQFLYNQMVWFQGLGHKEVIDPTMAYQCLDLQDGYPLNAYDEWNNCKIADAKILHWHGSRNAEKKLLTMQYLEDQFALSKPLRSIEQQTIDISKYD